MCFKTLTGGWEERGFVFVGRARSLIDLNILPRPVLKQSKGAFFLFLMSLRCLKCRLDVERNGLI